MQEDLRRHLLRDHRGSLAGGSDLQDDGASSRVNSQLTTEVLQVCHIRGDVPPCARAYTCRLNHHIQSLDLSIRALNLFNIPRSIILAPMMDPAAHS